MTKNRSIKIAVLVLALALITSCFVGTTFAKYQSTGSATGSLTVAKWDVSFAGENVSAETKTATINLFETILDTDAEDGSEATTGEKDVVDGKIAPGTKGAFDLEIVNNSEVSASYVVAFTVTNNSNVPLTFKVNGVENANLATNATGEILYTAAADDNTATINVEWEWAFGGDDSVATDTAIGAYGNGEAPVVTIKADATITQIN